LTPPKESLSTDSADDFRECFTMNPSLPTHGLNSSRSTTFFFFANLHRDSLSNLVQATTLALLAAAAVMVSVFVAGRVELKGVMTLAGGRTSADGECRWL